MKVGLVTLGCDKNTVDNEYLAGLLAEKGFTVTPASEEAPPDIVLINTCAFLQIARDQSEDHIQRWLKYRATHGTRLGVIGCYAQRAGEELLRKFPGIDFLAGVGDFERVAKLVAGEAKSRFLSNVGGQSWDLKTQSAPAVEDATADGSTSDIEFDDRAFAKNAPKVLVPRTLPRARLDARPHGFLKIADGCNHTCTFCSIPLMKGVYSSVPRQVILDEARRMLDSGVRELNIVAQDITKYGLDLEKRMALPDLLKDLCALDGQFWLRLFYLYPSTVTRDLVSVLKEERKIARYMDIPLQHLDEGVLRRMKRPHDRARTMDMLRMIRQELPDVTLRTTFIVGFPGESNKEFQTLLDAMDEIRFERLGVFVYSKEPGTPASDLPNQIPAKQAERRKEKVMKKQTAISAEWAARQVGRTKLCLVEGRIPGSDYYVARSESEAADIDGVVRVESARELRTGDFVTVRITEADVYDLMGVAEGM